MTIHDNSLVLFSRHSFLVIPLTPHTHHTFQKHTPPLLDLYTSTTNLYGFYDPVPGHTPIPLLASPLPLHFLKLQKNRLFSFTPDSSNTYQWPPLSPSPPSSSFFNLYQNSRVLSVCEADVFPGVFALFGTQTQVSSGRGDHSLLRGAHPVEKSLNGLYHFDMLNTWTCLNDSFAGGGIAPLEILTQVDECQDSFSCVSVGQCVLVLTSDRLQGVTCRVEEGGMSAETSLVVLHELGVWRECLARWYGFGRVLAVCSKGIQFMELERSQWVGLPRSRGPEKVCSVFGDGDGVVRVMKKKKKKNAGLVVVERFDTREGCPKWEVDRVLNFVVSKANQYNDLDGKKMFVTIVPMHL